MKKDNNVNFSSVDLVIGGLAGIGSIALTRSLVKSAVEKINPLFTVAFVALEAYAGIKTMSEAIYISAKVRDMATSITGGQKGGHIKEVEPSEEAEDAEDFD